MSFPPGTPLSVEGRAEELILRPSILAENHVSSRRTAATIAGLRHHQERHRALGHGFGFTVLGGSEMRTPVVTKSYHKINSGPFVETPHGPRLLRLSEIERIRAHAAGTSDYATGAELLGQGVLTGLFRQILGQLRHRLTLPDNMQS